jgi:hypothetical protein
MAGIFNKIFTGRAGVQKCRPTCLRAKFCSVVPTIFGSSELNALCVTLIEPEIVGVPRFFKNLLIPVLL